MGSGFYPKLREILLANGCKFVRQGKGSHEIWESPVTGVRLTISVTILARPLANRILKDAGIDIKL